MMLSIAFAGVAMLLSLATPTLSPEVPDHTSLSDRQVTALLAQAGNTDTEPYEYDVFTIPAFPGVKITLDGVTRETDSEGTTSFTVRRINGDLDEGVAARMIVETQELEIDERTVARYARPAERRQSVTLMYSRYYKTAFDFVDANGNEIPNSMIENTLVKSSTGEAIDIDVTGENWLLGSRVSGSAKPEIKPVFWTINDVIINSTSVAHRGQTKFFPQTETLVSSSLLLFDVRFRIVDAFFGFPAGDRLTLSTPLGETIELDLVDGEAEIDQLPRGEYEVVIEGSGLRIGRPVTLTRNQDLRLLYYTWLDISLVVIFLAGFLVLPFVIGHRRRKARERLTENADGELPESVDEADDDIDDHATTPQPIGPEEAST